MDVCMYACMYFILQNLNYRIGCIPPCVQTCIYIYIHTYKLSKYKSVTHSHLNPAWQANKISSSFVSSIGCRKAFVYLFCEILFRKSSINKSMFTSVIGLLKYECMHVEVHTLWQEQPQFYGASEYLLHIKVHVSKTLLYRYGQWFHSTKKNG